MKPLITCYWPQWISSTSLLWVELSVPGQKGSGGCRWGGRGSAAAGGVCLTLDYGIGWNWSIGIYWENTYGTSIGKRIFYVGSIGIIWEYGSIWYIYWENSPNHRIWRGTKFSGILRFLPKSPGTWFYGKNHDRTWISWIFHGLSREDQRLLIDLIDWLLNSGTSWSGGSFSCWMSTNSALQSFGWTYIL